MMNQLSQSKTKNFLIGIVPVVLVSILPAIYLFSRNSFLCPFSEVALPMLVSLGIGLLAYIGLYFVVGRNSFFSALFGTIMMILFSYFSVLKSLTALITGSDRSYFAYALALIIAIVACILLYRAREKKGLRFATIALSFFLGVIVLINLVSSIPGVVQRRSIEPKRVEATAVSQSKIMPNFYFIITDEYAEFDTMQTYFYYDLSPFHDFLTTNGFAVSTSSYNVSASTRINIANDLCLSDDATSLEMEYDDVLQTAADGALYSVLDELGYSTVGVSNMDDLFSCPSVLDSFNDIGVRAVSVSGKTPTKLLLDQSMLVAVAWRFPDNRWVGTAPSLIMDYMADPNFIQSESNTAVHWYIMSPHKPYSHTADGEIRPRTDWYDSSNPVFYLDQHIYTTSRLTEIIRVILAKDPNCVIVLQSDHNYRTSAEAGELPLSGVSIPYSEQKRILNAVYFKGDSIDIDMLSGPETLRLVLTKLGATIEP